MEPITALAPAEYQLYNQILDAVGGGQPFASACRDFGVSPASLLRKIAFFPALTARFQAERVAAAEEHFAKAIELADEVLAHPDSASAYKLAINTRQWAAEKLNPTAYGPRSESIITHKTAPSELTTREKLERFRNLAKHGPEQPLEVTASETGDPAYDSPSQDSELSELLR